MFKLPLQFVNFSVEDFEKGKLKNKAALQNKLGLEENPEVQRSMNEVYE